MFSDEKLSKREQKSNSFAFMPSAADFAQSEISFNDVPKAVAHLIRKVEKIETLLSAEQFVTSRKSCANREQNRTCSDFAEMQPILISYSKSMTNRVDKK
ncbi:MAG: hypothetical protein LBS50_00520 [Prevotellaceae bacterium]|jgi:hypothetical protein|nr:hypothetical protein [Prevotellaceae bacterium]